MNEHELYIPAPYNKYYELGNTSCKVPEAFNYYKDMKVLCNVFAKAEYADSLADMGLEYLFLVEDEVGNVLLVSAVGSRVYPVTLEEVFECVGSFTEDVSSSTESSTTVLTIEVMSGVNADGFTAIVKDSISGKEVFRQTYYYGYDASYDRRWASSRAPYVTDIINDLKSHYNVSDIEVTAGKNMFRGDSMSSDSVEKFKRDYLSEDVFGDAEYLDDYKESLFEDTQMTDAQRLALQELDTCLECGEITQEEHDDGQNIQWDINFEDVVLFVNGVEDSLKDIKHVAYGDCDESQFDGCYVVTLNNGQVKKYGWHDYDFSGALTLIDCNEGILDTVKSLANPLSLLSDHTNDSSGEVLTEDTDDGWEKPFDWAERYVKDGFVIHNNYQGAWHLEQTRPKTKHIGNYKSLEAAKSAGDAEINKRNAKNKDKPVQFGVHSFTSDSIVFRGTEDECAEYINKNGIENEAEIYMMNANDRHYLEEVAGKRFNNGDRVYVKVNNRQGTVTKMVSNDVVEVEFGAKGTYPARIDRYYVDEVELIDMTPELDEDVQDGSSTFEYIKRKYNGRTRYGTTVISGDRLAEIDNDLVSKGYSRGKHVTYSTGYGIDYVSSDGDKISVGVDNVPQYDRFGCVVDHTVETVIATNKLDIEDLSEYVEQY